MAKVYLLTGSNEGLSIELLAQASSLIHQQVGEVQLKSSIYKTAPWGNTNQQDFLNQVLLVETTLNPTEVLHTILGIEANMGRVRHHKWAPRTIDIDVLFYDQLVLQETDLSIPHPLLHERRFTLIPLAEIAPELIHPTLKLSIKMLLANCKDNSTVEKL